jgi:plasmid rolling circle replication initiator protein Rep
MKEKQFRDKKTDIKQYFEILHVLKMEKNVIVFQSLSQVSYLMLASQIISMKTKESSYVIYI